MAARAALPLRGRHPDQGSSRITWIALSLPHQRHLVMLSCYLFTTHPTLSSSPPQGSIWDFITLASLLRKARESLGSTAGCFGNGERASARDEGRETEDVEERRAHKQAHKRAHQRASSWLAFWRERRWRRSERALLRPPPAPGPGARRPKKNAMRGRSKTPSVWTSSRRRCGRRFSTSSTRTTSSRWL